MKVNRFGIPVLVIGTLTAGGAYWAAGYWQALLLSGASVLVGFGVALMVVNGFLNEAERKKAAMVLMKMVFDDVREYHNSFIQRGNERFGIPDWHAAIDSMNENNRNPDALSPEQREGVVEIGSFEIRVGLPVSEGAGGTRPNHTILW